MVARAKNALDRASSKLRAALSRHLRHILTTGDALPAKACARKHACKRAHWSALGRTGAHWDALGCTGMHCL